MVPHKGYQALLTSIKNILCYGGETICTKAHLWDNQDFGCIASPISTGFGLN